jgi:hypothetical protein
VRAAIESAAQADAAQADAIERATLAGYSALFGALAELGFKARNGGAPGSWPATATRPPTYQC